jgi:DNA-binding beta-propeller fold protein YncE
VGAVAKPYNSGMNQLFLKPLLSLITAASLFCPLQSLAQTVPVTQKGSVPTVAPLVLGPAIVLNSRDASLSLIDQTTFAEIGRVSVGKEPHHLYPSLDGKQLIVGNATSNDMHFVDPMSGKVLRHVRNIDDPYQLAFSPDQKLFVSIALRLNRVDIYRTEGENLHLIKRVPIAKAPCKTVTKLLPSI